MGQLPLRAHGAVFHSPQAGDFCWAGVLEGNLQGVPEAFHLEAATVG